MTTIEPRRIVNKVSFKEQTLPLCWNKRHDIEERMTEEMDSDTAVFQSGPRKDLLYQLVNMIDEAEEVICVSSFVIQKSEVTDSLLEAAKRGVRVYLLTASEKHLEKDEMEMSGFDRKVIPEHKALLDSFAGRILVRTANHLHSKFLLVDPHTSFPQGILLTANLTLGALYQDTNWRGRKYGCNFELGVSLVPEQVTELFNQFLVGFWHEAQHELFDPGVLTPVGQSPYPFSPSPQDLMMVIGSEQRLRDEVLELIDSATTHILASGWSFQDGHVTVDRLIEKAQSGVEVTVLARTHENNMPAFVRLLEAGATVFSHPRLHGKMLLVDGHEGIVMTANFSSLGLDEGYETGLKLSSEQVLGFQEIFEEWSQACEWSLHANLKKEAVNEEALVWENEKLELRSLKNNYHKKQEIQAPTMLAFFEPDLPTFTPSGDVLYLEATYEYLVHPPMLPSKAKLVEQKKAAKGEKKDGKKQEPTFPLFHRKNKNYVVITEEEEYPQAAQFARQNNAVVVARPVAETR